MLPWCSTTHVVFIYAICSTVCSREMLELGLGIWPPVWKLCRTFC